jgi:putative ABC transport system substrate-binding protein
MLAAPNVKRRVLVSSILGLAAMPRSSFAQGTPKPVRIGWLTAQKPASLTPYLAAMRASLADLGYVEGRNCTIEFRYGEDDIDRVPQLAAELVRLPVELIIAQGAAVPVLSTLNLPVPVVYVFSGDPITAGFADSLAHPRGNMTGLTFMAAEFNGKRLELFHEICPGLDRVAIIANPEHPGSDLERKYSEEGARRLGLSIQYFPTRNRDELKNAYAAMATNPPQAISIFADGFAIQNRQSIIDFGMRQHAPVFSGWPVFADSGALFTYGPRLIESYRRLAYYVDRVLKGAKPAELPIEQPTLFELVVNLRTAKALGITVPPSILAVADNVIA